MLKLPNKDPEEILDYAVSFLDLLEDGYVLDTRAAVVESMDPSESPSVLVVSNVSLQTALSPARNELVTFWLEGGIEGTTYVLKVTASDSLNMPKDRTYVRRVKIKVKKL